MKEASPKGSLFFDGSIYPLFGLFADVGENTAIDI